MNRIIWHHTGGGYRPSRDDLRAYHRVIDGDGQVHTGDHPISANEPGRPLSPGTYAAHCRNLNSGSIGIAIAAMVDGSWSNPFGGAAPVRPAQVDALIRETADQCRRFDIQPHRRFTLSHAEVEITLGVDQKQKWDFDYPPRGGPGARDPVTIGDDLRSELQRVISERMRAAPDYQDTHFEPVRRTLAQGATGDEVRMLQRALGFIGADVDGAFGPATRASVSAFQRKHQLLPDGVVGPMTWAALFA